MGVKCLVNGIEYDFELGEAVHDFSVCLNQWGWPSIAFARIRQTQFRNINHWFVVALHFGGQWPWLRIVNAFVGGEYEG